MNDDFGNMDFRKKTKNKNWGIAWINKSVGRISGEDARLAVLMDIREELRTLNMSLLKVAANTKRRKRKVKK